MKKVLKFDSTGVGFYLQELAPHFFHFLADVFRLLSHKIAYLNLVQDTNNACRKNLDDELPLESRCDGLTPNEL